jgi:DNA mismatch endonuclease, patch repair protein
MTESWASNERSRAVMRGNRSRDTKPELAIRSQLHRDGFRFRVNRRPVPEIQRSADIIFPRERVAVFVDGCFWHGCQHHYVAAKANSDYWSKKIEGNVHRDRATNDALNVRGWEVLRIWEHEDPERAARRIEMAVRAMRPDHTRRGKASVRPPAH